MAVRFLIADDMPAQQKLLANVVLLLGGESRCAANGREAFRLAQEEAFDIVLLDLSMPELGGVAAANRLIKGWASLDARPRIVVVTGNTDEASRTLCRAVGMDGFIPKPFDIVTARRFLARLLAQGHCWAEGPARRILDVGALDSKFVGQDGGFESEVLQARTSLQELVEKLDTLSPEQCLKRSEQLAAFARRCGLITLAAAMETFSAAAGDGEAASFNVQLAEQRADFEQGITAIREWRRHAPEPLRMSA